MRYGVTLVHILIIQVARLLINVIIRQRESGAVEAERQRQNDLLKCFFALVWFSRF